MGLCTSKKEHFEIPTQRISRQGPNYLNYDDTRYATLENYSGKLLPQKRYPKRQSCSTNTRSFDPDTPLGGELSDFIMYSDDW